MENTSQADIFTSNPETLTPIRLRHESEQAESRIAAEQAALEQEFAARRSEMEDRFAEVKRQLEQAQRLGTLEAWKELHAAGQTRAAVLLMVRFGQPEQIFEALGSSDSSEAWQILEEALPDDSAEFHEVTPVYEYLQQ